MQEALELVGEACSGECLEEACGRFYLVAGGLARSLGRQASEPYMIRATLGVLLGFLEEMAAAAWRRAWLAVWWRVCLGCLGLVWGLSPAWWAPWWGCSTFCSSW